MLVGNTEAPYYKLSNVNVGPDDRERKKVAKFYRTVNTERARLDPVRVLDKASCINNTVILHHQHQT